MPDLATGVRYPTTLTVEVPPLRGGELDRPSVKPWPSEKNVTFSGRWKCEGCRRKQRDYGELNLQQ